MDFAIKIVVLAVLLLLSAFFSSAETAFNCANVNRLKTLSEENNKNAAMALTIIDKYSKLISAILIGNNIVNIAASSLATTLAMLSGKSWVVSVTTGALTVLVLLFGEIVPKNWAKIKADKIVLVYAVFFKVLIIILTPVIFLVDLLSKGIMWLLRIKTDNDSPTYTEREIRTILEASHEEGVIEEDEKDMINNVFDLGDSKASDIMIPRIDMVMLPVTATYRETMNLIRENMYTRIPVYKDGKENVIGILNMKDLLFVKKPEEFKPEDFLREPYFTFENKNTSDLLAEMRTSSNSIAIVLNEYGDTEGMITLEDLLEEIVGEIRDEYDSDEEEHIRKTGENEYVVQGNLKLDDINDSLDTDFESEDYDSIGGLLIDNLDRLPRVNEEIVLENGTKLVALKIARNRIQLVKIVLPTGNKER